MTYRAQEDLFHRAFSARLLRLTLQGPLEGAWYVASRIRDLGCPSEFQCNVALARLPLYHVTFQKLACKARAQICSFRRSTGLLLCWHRHLRSFAGSEPWRRVKTATAGPGDS